MAALDFLFDPWMMQQPGEQPPFGGLSPQLPRGPMFQPPGVIPPPPPAYGAPISGEPEAGPAWQGPPTVPAMSGWVSDAMLKPMTTPSGPTLGDRLGGVPPDAWGSILKMLLPGGAGVAGGARSGADAGKPAWPAPPPPAPPPLSGAPVPFTDISSPQPVPTTGAPAPEMPSVQSPQAPPEPPSSTAVRPFSMPGMVNNAGSLAPVGMLDPNNNSPHPGAGGAPKVETIGPTVPQVPEGAGGFFDWLGKNRNMLAMMGAGIAGGKNTGDAVSGALQGSVHGRQMDVVQANQNQTEQALIAKGLDPQIAKVAASNPEILKALLPSIFNKASFKPLSTEQKTQLGLSPNLPWFMGNDGRPTLPEGIDKVAGHFGVVNEDDLGNKQYGFSNPYDKSVTPYTPSGASTQTQSTGAISQKLNEVRAAGGDPKAARGELTKMEVGTAVPSEVAGKLGIMIPFMKDYPKIKDTIAQGGLTGPIDWSMAKAGYGEQGQVYRAIQSGTDSLRRILTGAGMPAAEAAEYVSRYLPIYRDTAAVAADKVDRLQRELRSMSELLLQGHVRDAKAFIDKRIAEDPGAGGVTGGYKVLGVR